MKKERYMNKNLEEAARDQAPEFLTIRQASNLLQVSMPTLKKYSDKGIISRHRIGNRILYIRRELVEAVIGKK